MHRECTSCHRSFTPTDLCRTDSKNMEAERKAAGLMGVRFLYYHCPECGTDDIFVDILPREDEFVEDYYSRRDKMEAIARGLHADGVGVVVVPVKEP